MTAVKSLKGFAVIALIMETFFAIIYAFEEGYSKTVNFADMNGLIVAVFLTMLLLVGFGLVSVYLKEFAISGMTFNFIMLAFTIQMYFLTRKFWEGIKLGNPQSSINLMDNPFNIRLSLDDNVGTFFTLGQAVACAIAMFTIMFPLLGKVGPAESLIICIVGNFAYALNEVVFSRLNIEDNGYGMRIFLFGSTAGLAASFIVGTANTNNHLKYGSQYIYQAFGLIGCIFVWILLPWLSVIQQSQHQPAGVASSALAQNFAQIAPLNIMFALCSSCCASFATSIWLRGKISVHDIVFSAFSGGIAYGASSNVFPNPFPALLIGFLSGIIVTFANTKKKAMNSNGVLDSLGSLMVFFIPALLGGLYSSILFTTSAYGPRNTDVNVQTLSGRSRFGQGGYQLIGVALSLGIGLVAGLLIGLISKIFTGGRQSEQLFNDSSYVSQDFDALKQSKEVQVS